MDVLGDGSSLASAMNGDVRPRTATLWDQTSKPAATFTQDRQEKATTAPQQVSSSSTVLILESREPDAETDDFVMMYVDSSSFMRFNDVNSPTCVYGPYVAEVVRLKTRRPPTMKTLSQNQAQTSLLLPRNLLKTAMVSEWPKKLRNS